MSCCVLGFLSFFGSAGVSQSQAVGQSPYCSWTEDSGLGSKLQVITYLAFLTLSFLILEIMMIILTVDG